MSFLATHLRTITALAAISAACCTGCVGTRPAAPQFAGYDAAPVMAAAPAKPAGTPAVRQASATSSHARGGCGFG